MTTRLLIAAVAVGALAAPLAAQPIPRQAGGGRAQSTDVASQGRQGRPQDRAELERRFRENFAAEVKKRLQLTDDQMTRLMAVNQRLDAQRRQLFQQEREARMGLRTELANPDDRVNQQRVGELLETVLRVQRGRIELVEREQRELSAFLTPAQRARYQAFVDFVQRRIDDMDGRGEGRGGAPGGPGRGKRPPPTTPPTSPPPSR